MLHVGWYANFKGTIKPQVYNAQISMTEHSFWLHLQIPKWESEPVRNYYSFIYYSIPIEQGKEEGLWARTRASVR